MSQSTIHLPRQALEGARLRSDSFDAEANTVEIVWTTGATVRRCSWRDGDYDEVLETGAENVRLGRLNSGAPFLNTHARWSLGDVLGSVVAGSARMENGQGVATILLSRAPGHADIVQNIRDGVIANVSVGYIAHRIEKTEADDGSVPRWRVIDWEPFEISAVPVGADAGAHIRSADGGATPSTFPCVVTRADAPPAPAAPVARSEDAPVTTRTPDTADTALDTRAAPPAAAPTAPAVDLVAIRAEAATAERTRIAELRSIGTKLNLGAAVVERAIGDGSTVEAFRAVAIDAVASHQERSQPETFGAHAGASERGAATVPAQPATPIPPGVQATRSLVALAATRGDKRGAADFVSRHYGDEALARALSTSVGTSGGFLVPPEMASEVIELLRPESVVMSLGPNVIPMPRGNYTIPRMTGGASASYVGETQNGRASQPQFGAVQLQAKKLFALVPISNDMMRFPTIQTDTLVRNDMVAAIAERSDLAFLRSDGSQFSPRGLRSFANAPAIKATNVLSASTAVNLVTVTNDLGRAELALEQANVKMKKPGWVMSPRTKTFLTNLRDGLGNLVYSAEMAQGKLRGKPFRTTTQIPNNLVGNDGNGQTLDASEIYLADFAEVFIGEAYGLELDVFPGGTYIDSTGQLVSGISTDETVIRAIVQHDMAMRQEVAVAMLTNVRWF